MPTLGACFVFLATLRLSLAVSHNLYEKIDKLSNRKFVSAHPLVTYTQAGTHLKCATLCVSQADCSFFNYAATSGWCAISAMAYVNDDNTESADEQADIYVKDEFAVAASWLKSDCSTTADCPAPNAYCLLGSTCICRPGYYYERYTRRCTIWCLSSDVGVNFNRYNDVTFTRPPNSQSATATSREECQDACRSDTMCRAVTYHVDTTVCHLYYEGNLPSDFPGEFVDNSPRSAFSIKTCYV